MKSYAAKNLLELAKASDALIGRAQHLYNGTTALYRLTDRTLRTLAARIIAGDYPTMRNVVVEDEPVLFGRDPEAAAMDAEYEDWDHEPLALQKNQW